MASGKTLIVRLAIDTVTLQVRSYFLSRATSGSRPELLIRMSMISLFPIPGIRLHCDGVACQEFGREFRHEERARRVAYQAVFLAAERRDQGHPVVDVADGLVRFGG
jgi:hypothetical protein